MCTLPVTEKAVKITRRVLMVLQVVCEATLITCYCYTLPCWTTFHDTLWWKLRWPLWSILYMCTTCQTELLFAASAVMAKVVTSSVSEVSLKLRRVSKLRSATRRVSWHRWQTSDGSERQIFAGADTFLAVKLTQLQHSSPHLGTLQLFLQL